MIAHPCSSSKREPMCVTYYMDLVKKLKHDNLMILPGKHSQTNGSCNLPSIHHLTLKMTLKLYQSWWDFNPGGGQWGVVAGYRAGRQIWSTQSCLFFFPFRMRSSFYQFFVRAHSKSISNGNNKILAPGNFIILEVETHADIYMHYSHQYELFNLMRTNGGEKFTNCSKL